MEPDDVAARATPPIAWVPRSRWPIATGSGSANPPVGSAVPVETDEHGRGPVHDGSAYSERSVETLDAWLDAPDWASSQVYLRDHAGILRDDPARSELIRRHDADP